MRRECEPETEQHPTGCQALRGRAPGSRDPAHGRRAARAAQIEPPGERADETWAKDTVAMEEESDERRREAETCVARSRLPVPAPRVRSGASSVRSPPPVVLVEVVEDRVSVQ